MFLAPPNLSCHPSLQYRVDGAYCYSSTSMPLVNDQMKVCFGSVFFFFHTRLQFSKSLSPECVSNMWLLRTPCEHFRQEKAIKSKQILPNFASLISSLVTVKN